MQVPALVVIDWGGTHIHTRGTINGYLEIGSKEKWLLIHAQKKWRYYYEAPAVARQEAFLKKYLKGEKSAFDSYPKVELEIRDRAWEGNFRRGNEWLLARTQYTKKYIDNATKQLVDDVPTQYCTGSYQSDVHDDCIEYLYPFDSETEVTGHTRLRLWVSAEKAEDMDLFVQLDKIDTNGKETPFLAFTTSDEGPMTLGWLCVSHRELDLNKSYNERPFHTHTRELLLRPDEIVPVDIEVLATSARFQAGETLKVKIQGNDTTKKSMSNIGAGHDNLRNKGKHFIHSGPLHESYINLPIVPEK